MEKDEKTLYVTKRSDSEKGKLRAALIEKRNEIPEDERAERDRIICEKVTGLPAFRKATAVLLYAPIGKEIDVGAIREEAWRRGVPVGLPVCDRAERSMVFRRTFPNVPLTEGDFGIPVPPETAEIILPDRNSVCVLPALAYDRDRNRIGYGGGYYDRFLADFPGVAVGVAYEENVLGSVCAGEHDRAAAVVVTEKRVF